MISIALLGVGRVFDGRLIEVFRDELSGIRVEVVCDLDSEKSARVAQIFRSDSATIDSKEFWNRDFDVVYIATESGNHFV